MKEALTLAIMRIADSPSFWHLASACLGPLAALARSPRWFVLAGYARERLGDWDGARSSYARAATAASRAEAAAPARWLHAAQFFLERASRMLGEGWVEDPLFVCTIRPEGNARNERVAGFYKAEFVFSGMQIIGGLPKGRSHSVDLLLDGRKIRSINVVSGKLRSSFSFKVTRRALRLFPRDCVLAIAGEDGTPLFPLSGGCAIRLSIPHGVESPSPLVSGSRLMDKKGVPVPSPEELEAERAAFLAIYAEARDFFLSHFGKQLFLAYGTLLGYYREGGFIPDDDDFDAGFMAEAHAPKAVKAEVLDMILVLVEAGFSVSFNRRGRLFRLHRRGAGTAGPHIDVHSFWVQGDKVYAHNDFCAAEDRSCYLPAGEGTLAGTPVFVPARTEVFLADQYGPGWRHPDPGFVNRYEAKDSAVLANLGQALLSPLEFRAVSRRVEAIRAERGEAGEFLSIGAANLYPLTGRDEDLE